MRRGLDWYKREPIAYLGGVQGLTAREHAVYSIVLDLLYTHGGEINNDPGWIAGWVSDMGSAAVRRTLESLVAKGKLTFTADEKITQRRVVREVKIRQKPEENRGKTDEKPTKNREKTAEKPEENASFSGTKSNENNDLRDDTPSRAHA